MKNGDVTLLDHAAYLGRELYKAELAIRYGRSFEQDGEF
jgi:dihydropteroate synthase